MAINLPYRSDWTIGSSLPDEEIISILSQPFRYLDRGAQCYVFESHDHRYVIKLFRYDQRSLWHRKKRSQPLSKTEKLFSGCILAFTKAKEETGIVFLHLNPTEGKLPTLHAKGPIRQSIDLPLDRYRFVIQKKMVPFQESLLEAYLSSDPEKMQRRIDSFMTLIRNRSSKGIKNTDPSLSRNFGYLGDRAYEIDFGNYLESSETSELEVLKFSRKLRSWLLDNAPEWVSYLDSVCHG